MTVHIPGLPFSLDPLIAEAKRRARQRRFLLAVVGAVVALAVGGAVYATRSAAALVAGPPAPGCPAHGAGASYLASARTRTAQRDEVRLLCLVVVPQGAQLLTREPAPMARVRRIFGSFPRPYAPFARHRFLQVHASVAALVNFEKAHPPAGSSDGCGAQTAGDCGVGVLGGPNVPPNASLQFNLPPIRGRVGSRALNMTILALPGGWTAIRVDAVNRPRTPA